VHHKSFVTIAAVLGVGAVTAGIAYAAIPGSDGTIQGCYGKIGGILRVVDSASQCKASLEVPIKWSQEGQKGDPGLNGTNGADGVNGAPGAPGISPTVTALSPGDANCPAGGAALTDSTGSTAYVCSGQNGQAGADGQPFSGTFTSPNGQYSISVTDAGINITGTSGANILLHNNDLSVRSGTVSVDANTDVQVRTGSNLSLQSGSDMTMRAGRNFALQASDNATVTAAATASLSGTSTNITGAAETSINGGITTVNGSGLTKIQGGVVIVGGGGCLPAARVTDPVVGVAVGNPGVVTGSIAAGSPDVCVG
jgi:hypothetical protein